MDVLLALVLIKKPNCGFVNQYILTGRGNGGLFGAFGWTSNRGHCLSVHILLNKFSEFVHHVRYLIVDLLFKVGELLLAYEFVGWVGDLLLQSCDFLSDSFDLFVVYLRR